MNRFIPIMLIIVGCASPTGPTSHVDAVVTRSLSNGTNSGDPAPLQLSSRGSGRPVRASRTVPTGHATTVRVFTKWTTYRVDIPHVQRRTHVILRVPDPRRATCQVFIMPGLDAAITAWPHVEMVLKITDRPLSLYYRTNGHGWTSLPVEQTMTRNGIRLTAEIPGAGEILVSDGTTKTTGSGS